MQYRFPWPTATKATPTQGEMFNTTISHNGQECVPVPVPKLKAMYTQLERLMQGQWTGWDKTAFGLGVAMVAFCGGYSLSQSIKPQFIEVEKIVTVEKPVTVEKTVTVDRNCLIFCK